MGSVASSQDHGHQLITFLGILAMIQPLYFVALTELNTSAVRAFAVKALRSIAASTGVLQAALLADTAARSFYNDSDYFKVC